MAIRDLRSRVERRLREAKVQLKPEQIDQLHDYFCLLAKWNQRLNLTALPLEAEKAEAIDRLLVEPVLASQDMAIGDSLLIDLGSGGGSPAIPLKICAPWVRLVMVEAKVRKAAFLRDAVRQLALGSVEVANARFEELLSRVDLHEAADVVSVRAVRADRKLWNPVHAFLKPQGRVLWFTSGQPESLADSGLTTASSRGLPGTSRLVILKKSN